MFNSNCVFTRSKHNSIVLLLFITAMFLFFLEPLHAQIGQVKILASDGVAEDDYGWSVSISGDYAIVGAYMDDDSGSASGSAYIYNRSGVIWTEQAKLTASDGAIDDHFGWTVAISGDYAVVGAYKNSDNGFLSGSAYVYMRSGSTWSQQAKLLPSDGSTDDHFGWSVAISGDYAVIGAISASGGLGSVYVYLRDGTNWSEQAILLASDGADGALFDRFGEAVAISGDYVVVGASSDDDNGTSSGSAYVYMRSGTNWSEQAKLLPSVGAEFDFYGSTVSISGDYIVVGNPQNDDNGDKAGSANVYMRSGTSWPQQAKLLASDGAASDFFGAGVSISGDLISVGARSDDDNGGSSGSIYIFRRNGTSWPQSDKVVAFDGEAVDHFGRSIAGDSASIIVGAWGDDDNGTDAGSAYILNLFNTAPVITSADSVNAFEDLEFSYTVTVINLERNNLSYIFSDLSSWLSVLGTTVSGTPTEGVTSGAFTVIVSDDSFSDSLDVTITVAAVNDPPMFVDFPDSIEIVLGESDTLILSEFATDIDDPDTLLIWSTLNCLGADSIACVTMNADSAIIQTIGDISGFQELTFIVSDTSGASDSVSTIIVVKLVVGIANEGLIPQEYSLADNFPNPFNPQTTVSYGLPKQSNLSLIIYNLTGQEIMRWDEQNSLPGFYQKIWNGTNKFGVSAGSGVYFYRIIAGDFVQTKKMVLLK